MVNKNKKINVCIVTIISFAFIVIGSLILNYSMDIVRKSDDNRVEMITLADKRNIGVNNDNKSNKKNDVVDNSDIDKTSRRYNSVDNSKAAIKSDAIKKDDKSSDVKTKDSVESNKKNDNGSFSETEKSKVGENGVSVGSKDNKQEKNNNKTTASPDNTTGGESVKSDGKALFYEGETNKIEYSDGKNVWNISMIISSAKGDIRGPQDLKETDAFEIALRRIKEVYGTELKTKEVTMYFSDKGLGSNIRYYYGCIGSESDEEKYMFEVNSITGDVMSVEKY